MIVCVVQVAQTAVAEAASVKATISFFMLSPQKGASSKSSNPLEGLEAFLTGAESLGLTDKLINFLPVFSLVLSHPDTQRSMPLTFRLPL
jgi:hypothetical protein